MNSSPLMDCPNTQLPGLLAAANLVIHPCIGSLFPCLPSLFPHSCFHVIVPKSLPQALLSGEAETDRQALADGGLCRTW